MSGAFLATYIAVLIFLAYVLLFGETSTNKNGFIAKTHWFLTTGLCQGLGGILGMCFGNFGRSLPTKIVDKLFNQRNPILQIFFLSMGLGLPIWFWKEAVHHIPTASIGVIQAYVVLPILVVAANGLFLTACYVDAGTLTVSNQTKMGKVYPHDEVIYQPKYCETCKLNRPARTKHCSMCGRCVLRFDHHCGWINQCVGANNYKWFISFLFATAVLCLYGTYMTVRICLDIINEKRIWEWTYPGADGQQHRATMSMVFAYMMGKYSAFASLAFFTAVLGTCVLLFGLYHFYLASRNTTTNETFKWGDIDERIRIHQHWRDRMAAREKQQEQDKGKGKGKKAEKTATKDPLDDLADVEWKTDKELYALRVNTYDRGFVQNLREVFSYSAWVEERAKAPPAPMTSAQKEATEKRAASGNSGPVSSGNPRKNTKKRR